ncbi:uncharacterized protein LOC102807941 [Saccoglossus kowalevskii]|uniref:Prostate stem cell antigen-like n=1 Tax=Saccoglossus kowalevskii TaxID=10224 RepID=A0ABM0MJ57_SACKO|nr:PREDICTED: prostate stem cell antigen-like [Saccoglossus kowalevskii]
MEMKVVLLFVLGMIWSSRALKCYTCSTADSQHSNCQKDFEDTAVACHDVDEPTCFVSNYTIVGVSNVFTRGCTELSQCTSEMLCSSVQYGTTLCELSCCNIDLCNGTSALMCNYKLSVMALILLCFFI